MPTDIMKSNYRWTTHVTNDGNVRSVLHIPNAHVYITMRVAKKTCNVQIALNPVDLSNGCELNILDKDMRSDDLKAVQQESVAILFDYLNSINTAIKDVLIDAIVSKP